jgi:hypothetical protein
MTVIGAMIARGWNCSDEANSHLRSIPHRVHGSSPTVASLSAVFPRQVKCATAGVYFRIAGKEGRRVKCADPVEAQANIWNELLAREQFLPVTDVRIRVRLPQARDLKSVSLLRTEQGPKWSVRDGWVELTTSVLVYEAVRVELAGRRKESDLTPALVNAGAKAARMGAFLVSPDGVIVGAGL